MPEFEQEPIDVIVPGCADDPRSAIPAPPGVAVHRVPLLHPDDITIHKGIPVTSVSRTLVDLAEVLSHDELHDAFQTARERGLLDITAVKASYDRLEWRPSLAMLREVIDEFAD